MKANKPFPKQRSTRNVLLRFAHTKNPDFRKLISQCKDNGKCPVSEVIDYGGAGSGDFGHRGRPGQVGGSAGGGGRGSQAASRGTSGDGDDFTPEELGITPRGPEFNPAGSPDSPDFVGPPDPRGRSFDGTLSRAKSAPRTTSIRLKKQARIPGPEFDSTGNPSDPGFVGPPPIGFVGPSVPAPKGGGILKGLRDVALNALAIGPGLGARALVNKDGSDSALAKNLKKVIDDTGLPAESVTTLEIVNLLSNIAFSRMLLKHPNDSEFENKEKAEAGIDKFKDSIIGVSREEILKSVRKDFKRIATNAMLKDIADQIFKGDIKPDKDSVQKAIEAMQAEFRGEGGTGNFGGKRDPNENATKQFSRLRKGVKEALTKIDALSITSKIEKFLAFEIMNGDLKTDDASIKKAFDDLISAREGLKADKAQAKEDEKLAKAEAKAIKKIEKEKAKAEADEFKRVNKVVRRARFISGPKGSTDPVPSDAKEPVEPVEPPPTVSAIIEDIDDIPEEEVAELVRLSLGASENIEEDVKALKAAGIMIQVGGGSGERAQIASQSGGRPQTIDIEKISACGQRSRLEKSGKDTDLQTILDNAIDNGAIDSDSNVSEVITGLQKSCPLDDVTDFTRFLLKKSDNKEEDIEILINDGIADRDEAGNAFIVEENVTKNSEDVYALAESCPITSNNGCPLFQSNFAENNNKDIGWKEVFEFDDSNVLNILVKNFTKLKNKLSPPIKLGHDESQKLVQNSGFPSAGWITGLKRKGTTNKLLAFFSNVPSPIVKLIESGAYKRISAEIYNNYIDPDTHKEFGPAMRAVSILGADVPRIKTLNDLAIIYHSDGLPYKTFQTEDIEMDVIMQMIEALKAEIVSLAGLSKDDNRGEGEVEEAVDALQEKFGEAASSITALCEKQEKEIKKLEKSNKKSFKFGDNAEVTQLSETVENQANLITQLSESVKTIGSELKTAQESALETKKASIQASLSKNFSPALVEKAMPLINFSEGEDKVVELLKSMHELQENDALFLTEPLDIEQEEFETSFKGNSQDKIFNDVTALSEKEKCSFNDAFDKYQLIQQAAKK